MTTLKALRHCAPTLLIWLGLTGAAGAQTDAPTASPVVDGTYTVTYPAYCEGFGIPLSCEFAYLFEMTEPGGDWTFVSAYSGSETFTKPPGSYSYYVWSAAYTYWYGYIDSYSSVLTVTVPDAAPPAPEEPVAPVAAPPAAPASPGRENILTQLNYAYEVRQGDFDRDNRTDFFIKRIAGGTPFNGTIEELILRQDPVVNGKFSTFTPTPDQALVASSWTLAPTIETRLQDIDVDGFVDLTLLNLDSVVPWTADQIVYSPGQVGAAMPGGMKPIDQRFLRFVGDAMDYMADPDYFVKNVPVYYIEVWSWYSWCPYFGTGGLDGYYSFYSFSYCYIDYNYYAGFFADFSVFDGDAVALWSFDEEVEQGLATEEQAVAAIVRVLESILQSQLGGWPMEELLGQTGEHVLEHVRRRIEAAQGVLNAARALPEHVDMDNLPPQTPRARDVIHVTGHRIKRTTKAHLALEYARPQAVDGMYWPTTLSGEAENWPPVPCFPWMDYSFCGWGKLLAESNKSTDLWYLNWTVGYVVPWEGTPGAYWSNTLEPRHNRYIEVPYALKPDYNALPDAATNTYNSNSYVNGLNGVDGWFVVPLAMNSVYPGWDRPVPDAFFQ